MRLKNAYITKRLYTDFYREKKIERNSESFHNTGRFLATPDRRRRSIFVDIRNRFEIGSGGKLA